MTLYTSDKRLPGSKPGQITSSGKIAGLLKKGTIWYEVGQLPDGKWLYSTEKGYVPPVDPVEPPVTPPPPPPPPVSTDLGALSAGEAFIQTDNMAVGFNAFGGIGTAKPALKGFRSDTRTGLLRLGLFAGTMLATNAPKPKGQLDDLILQGAAIEGFVVFINGVRYANIALRGFSQIPGELVSPTEWRGAVAGVEVVQRVSIEGKRLRISVTHTNRSGVPLNVQYLRCADFDQSSDDAGGTNNFNTTSTVTAPGIMESKLYGGGKVIVRAEGATFAVQPYNKPADIGTFRPVGGSKTADDVLQAVFPSAPLAPGQSVTHVVEYEVVTP